MESEERKGIAGFFVVELMGKTVLPGFVQEMIICNTSFLRIDVPTVDEVKGFSKIFHPQAIFSLTPVDYELCRTMVKIRKPKPFTLYYGEYKTEDDSNTPF
jgi:hypothetical protein